ncbi:MAG: hypothetical protein ABIG68_13595, partial [Acidobacteriota bacterium]
MIPSRVKDKTEWARRKAESLLRASSQSRMYWDSVDALSLCYASGRQWAYVADATSGGALRRLKEVIDPGSNDVRVTLDRTSRLVRKVSASLKPRRLAAQVISLGNIADALSAKQVYEEILSQTVRDIRGLGVYRAAQLPRVVLGTAYIRRYIREQGRPLLLKPDGGGPENGHMRLRDLRIGWNVTLPWEVVRDPAATTPDVADWESIIGVEKPWSLRQVKRQFPDARQADRQGVSGELSSGTTYGELMAFQNEVSRVSGRPLPVGAVDSREPALIVYEFLLRDEDEPGDWVWQYIAGFDPHDRGAPEGEGFLKTLHMGPNPHWGTFLHPYHYEAQVNSPRARGLPLCVKQLQDITNVSLSSMARVLVTAAQNRWMFQDGTVDKPDEAFSDRADRPIAVKFPAVQGAPFFRPERVPPG